MTAKIHKLFTYLHFLILPIFGSLDSSSTIGRICPRRVPPQLKSFETEKETKFMIGNKTRKRVAFCEEIFSHPHFWPFRSAVKAWWDEDWIVSRGKVIQKSSTIKALNYKFLQYFFTITILFVMYTLEHCCQYPFTAMKLLRKRSK